MSNTLYVLFETAYGYALFERLESDEIGQELDAVTAAMQDLGKFGRAIKLQAFLPFKNAAEALQNINEVSEGIMGDTLRQFLELNLPKSKKSKDGTPKKSASFSLGVSDKTLASTIKGELGVECVSDETVLEVVRGLRLFAHTMLKQFREGDLEKAQLGLGHSYSRAKVKFNVHRSDNMIIQSSALLDQLDKDINTFAMRMREWYGWHFPELTRLIPDHRLFAKVALSIPDKSSVTEEDLPAIEAAADGDAGLAKLVLEAARHSMGTDINELDMINIKNFARRVLALSEYRLKLHSYLTGKMDIVAPNLSALIGEIVGARLISHAGSLTNLSKFPASTVQILGAEKALFRALKTKGKTPKYGLIYHSSFIGKAGAKNKGRISRYLANKCSIASRLDCFADVPTNKFGDALRAQVEERLDFYEKGTQPTKNADVMSKVMAIVEKEQAKKEKKSKKKDDSKDEVVVASPKKDKKSRESKKEEAAAVSPKKDKKSRKSESAPVEEEETPKKKSKVEVVSSKQDKQDKKEKKEKKDKKVKA
ncbi:Nop-domain-containing protein [Paramicrosporidium saccamoebae]|uniref:Nucleolar protein 56 n=1 Tax=Paramicrosporidium saccamoebae TaxID=1246581 RepID=A0A2H9TPV8_9FUNG|nr:Nop-domain-containing protein [Paramicrosporidium saccamoebae]